MSTEQTGIVKGNTNIRTKASLDSAVIFVQQSEIKVKIIETTRSSDGQTWYFVKYGQRESEVGWVNASRITVSQETTSPSRNPKKYRLTVRTNTWFKEFPTDDASRLHDDQKVSVNTGNTYSLSAYKLESSHYRFTLSDTLIRNKNTWFVFKDHVKIDEL